MGFDCMIICSNHLAGRVIRNINFLVKSRWLPSWNLRVSHQKNLGSLSSTIATQQNTRSPNNSIFLTHFSESQKKGIVSFYISNIQSL